VTERAAEATGLPPGIAVYATANDKAVEALGAGLTAESDLLLSLGTYISAMTAGTRAVASDDRYWVNFGSRPGRYLYESDGIRRGMWTVSWFRSLLHDDEAAGGGDDAMYDLESRLNESAARVPPGSGGLMTVLDWLAPGHAPHRRGAFVGFDGSQDRAAVYRSILEGIAFTMADHAHAMESALGRRFERVILTGGGARSALMRQIVADVFGLPVVVAEVDDAAGMGAAVCAAVGGRLQPGWDAAQAAMVRHSSPVAPIPENSLAYERFHRVHTGLRARTDDLFAWMAAELGASEFGAAEVEPVGLGAAADGVAG
jgi:sugar (pentulose or hexulose) kinase